MVSTYTLTDSQKQQLFTALSTLKINPYLDYNNFRNNVGSLISNGNIPAFFINIGDEILKERNDKKIYAQLLRNVPLDQEIPEFDQDDPVTDKYRKKTSFIGEAFLELLSHLTLSPLLAYETRNNGDFFHDVYSHNKYTQTQTQKTDGELFYHNDRTAHPVRADYLSLLGMRCHEENLIYTGYLDGRELLKNLDAQQQTILRQPYFITPYDEYSKDSNNTQVFSDHHVILENDHSFRYYDTRTTYILNAPTAALDALLALKNAIIKAPKKNIKIRTGELFSFANQDALHNRNLVEIANPEGAKKRWLLKTYSFRNHAARDRFNPYFREGVPGRVKEIHT